MPEGESGQKESAFVDEKKALRWTYKAWKAGLIPEEYISPRMKFLLVKYYGCRFVS